jgi:prephenate dehydratase
MSQIIFLGPEGATFSYEAYLRFSEVYNTPKVYDSSSELVSLKTNALILQTVSKSTDGYGVIAMETRAEGKVVEPVESFMDLLDGKSTVSIIGAIRMELHFALMARKGVRLEDVRSILGHKKAIGACKGRINHLAVDAIEKDSNGQAAEEVAHNNVYRDCGALSIKKAAEKYGLNVLADSFEDERAVTTFFLLGPSKSIPKVGMINRALVVCKLRHKSGSLVDALIPFRDEGISLVHIHSVYIGNGEYGFVMEMEVSSEQVQSFHKAVRRFKSQVLSSLVFGPFEIV